MKARTYQVGDLVFIRHPNFNCRGYVYEIYPDYDDGAKKGVSIVTEHKKDTGGWSFKEQERWLEFVAETGFLYFYTDHAALERDISRGVFERVFYDLNEPRDPALERSAALAIIQIYRRDHPKTVEQIKALRIEGYTPGQIESMARRANANHPEHWFTMAKYIFEGN